MRLGSCIYNRRRQRILHAIITNQMVGFSGYHPLAIIGLLQLAITWYKIGHAGGQAHYYSRYGTLKQRDLNQ